MQLFEYDNQAHSQYSLGYLQPMTKVGRVETLEIGFGENYPLAINFAFHDGAVEVKYFLAPELKGYLISILPTAAIFAS